MFTDALESEDPISVSSRENCVNIQEQHEMETNPIECDDVENKRKRRCTSVMWEHFVKKKINGVDYAICNYCKDKLKANSRNGTKSLYDHFNRCRCRKQKNIRTMLHSSKTADGKVEVGTYSFNQEASRKELAHMIILHEYPLSMVEHLGFRRFMKSVQPLFTVVSRNTIKNDILKIYDYERSKTMQLLERNDSRIAITTDMWTSNQKKGFMAVTAHFIDESWKLQSRILR